MTSSRYRHKPVCIRIAPAAVLLLVLFLSSSLPGCRQAEPATGATRPSAATTATAETATTATATGSVAIGSLSTRDIGSSVRVTGTVRAIQRQAGGHALVTLADASGKISIYIRQETRIDLLALTVGEAYQASGRIQSYEGHIELVPAGGGDMRLTDGYDFEPVQVVSVIDGDTLRIRSQDGTVQTLRVIGVDTPEKSLDGQPAEFYAAEATAFADRTLRGKTVYLERDNSETDRYGRLLRYVWLAEPEAITLEAIARANFSALLLQGGYAEFIDVGSDDKYRSVFEPWELQAQQARKGMWAKR